MTQDIAPQAPLTRLLCAYARPEDAAAARLVWALDERLADLVRSTSQPMIGQMRIAWWDEALGDDSGAKGRGDPLVDALRATGVARRPGLPAMLDGWEALLGDGIDSASLRTFADGRGGGLFRAVADEHEGPPWLAASGRLWALWDLARHLGPDDPMRAAALDLAREALPGIVAAPLEDAAPRHRPRPARRRQGAFAIRPVDAAPLSALGKAGDAGRLGGRGCAGCWWRRWRPCCWSRAASSGGRAGRPMIRCPRR
jgi:phytoene synthase